MVGEGSVLPQRSWRLIITLHIHVVLLREKMIEGLVVRSASRLTVQTDYVLFDNRCWAEYLLELSVLVFLSRVLLISCCSSILGLRLNILATLIDLLTIIILQQVHLGGGGCGWTCRLIRIAPVLVGVKVVHKMTAYLHILLLGCLWLRPLDVLLHVVREVVNVGWDYACYLLLEVLLLVLLVWIRLRC